DIHGAAKCCREMLSAFEREGADKLILLGDILYHGPRNDLPEDYAPKEVIALLNAKKNDLLCVRGNCEAEVDQMVLEFPVMADYMALWLEGHMAMCTHGHLYDIENIPNISKGDIIISGHTHLLRAEEKDGIYYINPGSVSIPKGGNPRSYAVYEGGKFIIKEMNGEEICGINILQ
ncbi:MAG: phosphodiesterase, partial [Oscillospiraceae bacterium]|nr:phosphodiesterase [Oscillospiraceae bacterium]